MNFNGYKCPKCGNAVTRDKNFYKCRCGWSYRSPAQNYMVQMRKRFEAEDAARLAKLQEGNTR